MQVCSIVFLVRIVSFSVISGASSIYKTVSVAIMQCFPIPPIFLPREAYRNRTEVFKGASGKERNL